MKGLVEKFTGEEVEVTRKPEATKSPSQATQKAKPQTATISVHTRDDEKGNQRNSSGEQNRGQDRTRQDRNDRRGTNSLKPLLHRLILDHDIIFYFKKTLKKIKKN